jgi:glycerol-3-phosphate dehydrogenase (NAD(P)+)
MGSGSWGTAFGMVLADAGTDVVLWGRERALAETITTRHENPVFHPGVALPPSIRATTDPARALHGANFVVLAIPAQALRENLETWRPEVAPDATYVSLMKGVELGTTKRMSEVIRDCTGTDPAHVAVVSGPNLAKEIAVRQPAATVVASAREDTARRLQAACLTGYFRPYTNTDVVGVELGGTVKNVIALAVGMAAGMGFGDNSRASIITRGLAETVRLGLALGADPMTFSGLAGLGDLVATCMSPLSRNRTFGENLGKGMTVAEAVAVTEQTAEGVKSCRSVLDLARKHGVDMPITEQVVAALYGGVAPREVVANLMGRRAKAEQG